MISRKVLSSSISNPEDDILELNGTGTPHKVTHKWKYDVALYFTIVICSI